LYASKSGHVVAKHRLRELHFTRQEGSGWVSVCIVAACVIVEIQDFAWDHDGEELLGGSRERFPEGLPDLP
jgi:hypothetical protein